MINGEIPKKAKFLSQLRDAGFTVPDFIYMPAEDFENENFSALKNFLESQKDSFKVIVRSAHPKEYYFKGGTFDSMATYADLAGIKFARKRIIKMARTTKHLCIKRQQTFDKAPEVDLDQMGIIVMPFINGSYVMAKKLWDYWEFGYCRDRVHKVQSEPFITRTPHDRRLLQESENIQEYLGFSCEIEYVISEDNTIYVVQAKDISNIEILEQRESARSICLDGVRRIRKRRNYRERPAFVLDSKAFYLDLLTICEEMVEGNSSFEDVLDCIKTFQKSLEDFALRYQRFAIIGLSIRAPAELFQTANHYLDDRPELQVQLTKALREKLYAIDTFIAEADTLIAKDKYRIRLCGHDAYGIDTVRNPMWSVYWSIERHRQVKKELRRIGFKTGDAIGINIDENGKPTVYRL